MGRNEEALYHAAGAHSDSDEEHDSLVERHHCTDVPCCLLFILAIGAILTLAFNAAQEGGIGKLYSGIDVKGNICGVDEVVGGAPLLAWCFAPGPSGELSTSSFEIATSQCVSECPSSDTGVEPVQCPEGSYSAKNSRPFLSRYCIPEVVFKDGLKQIKATEMDGAEQHISLAVASIGAAWPLLVFVFFVAFVMGFLYLGIMRCCAEALIWLSIVASVLGFGAIGFYLWVNAGSFGERFLEEGQVSEDLMEHEESAARVVAAVCWALSAGVVVLACCLGSSIQRSVACVEAACDAIFEMPSLLLAPAVKACVQGVLALILLKGFLLVYSMGEVSPGGKGGIGRHIEHTDQEWGYIVGYVLMAFWVIAFANALYQFTITFAFAQYYYAPYDMKHEKDVNGCCAGFKGFYIGLVYHSGSLAFGSLIVAVLHAVQKLVEYAQAKNSETVDSKLVECVLCCVNCCVGCCAEAVEFVNKNAYIDMAVTSKSFCESAKGAFHVIVDQAGTMSILNGATYMFTVFGTLVITASCGLMLFVASTQGPFAEAGPNQVTDPVAVAVTGMVIAFCVSLSFMHVFDMASDTLLYCYAKDMQNHNVSNTAPHEFQELMDKHEGGHFGH